MTLRQTFDERLESLRSGVIRMGDLAAEMVRKACDAAISSDFELANEVIVADNEVDRMEDDLIHQCVALVVQELPVARDLRLLVASLGVVGEIEKVADHAVKLAGRATRLTAQFPAEMKTPLAEMGELARRAFGSALRLYSNYDVALADEIIRNDELIDDKYAEARRAIIDLIRKNPESSDSLVRTLDAIHTMEHVADHAVEIAKRLKVHQVQRA